MALEDHSSLISLTVNNEVLFLSDRADALCVILESVVRLRHFSSDDSSSVEPVWRQV